MNTNGLVELLSGAETCSDCQLPLTHASGRAAAQGLEVLFAANDDLIAGAVLEVTPGRVEMDWIGHTKADGELNGTGLGFGVVLNRVATRSGASSTWGGTDAPATSSPASTIPRSRRRSMRWNSPPSMSSARHSIAPSPPESMNLVFLTPDPVADMDESGAVNFADLARLKLFFLLPPGPSGVKP